MTRSSSPAEPLSAADLAAWVDATCSQADELLFTATAREDLEGIASWQRLSDLAFAGQCRAIVAAVNRASAAEREFVADEVGLAIGASPTAGSLLTTVALSAAELPGLLEAVEAGLLTERHVRAVLRELGRVPLNLEQRAAIAMVLLSRYRGQTPGELAELLRRLVLTVDLPAAQRRQDQASRGPSVRCWNDVDGQAVLQARGPLALIAAAKASLDATLPLHAAEAGDDRSTDARMFDLFIDLLTGGADGPGRWEAQILIPVTTAQGGEVELAEIPGFGPVLPSTAKDLLDSADALRRVTIDAETGQVVTVDDATPARTARPAAAETDGSAPTAADVLTEPAAGGPGPASAGFGDEVLDEPVVEDGLRVDPRTGELLDPATPSAARRCHGTPGADRVGNRDGDRRCDRDRVLSLLARMRTEPVMRRDLSTHAYRPSGRLVRFLQARDRTCTFPGCHRRVTDKDHRIAWPQGPTSPVNMGCLCRRHHRAKHTSFTVTRQPDGTLVWTTRGGQQFCRLPKGY